MVYGEIFNKAPCNIEHRAPTSREAACAPGYTWASKISTRQRRHHFMESQLYMNWRYQNLKKRTILKGWIKSHGCINTTLMRGDSGTVRPFIRGPPRPLRRRRPPHRHTQHDSTFASKSNDFRHILIIRFHPNNNSLMVTKRFVTLSKATLWFS